MASKKFPEARRKLFYTTAQGKESEEGEEKCFLYSEDRLGIQGMVSYLGYCLS